MTTQNVDFSEIKKFEDLAERWWDKNSEFKPLHDINPLRVDFINQHSGGVGGKKILDVGCGGGILADALSKMGAEVTGIDMGEAPLSVARLHQLESGQSVHYQQITAEELAATEGQSFDIVTCLEMLEHVPDPGSVINACQQLVKPGGDVFFSTLNRNPKSFLFAIVGAEYILNMLPKGTHEFAKFIKPSELDRWARACHLELRTMTGMHFNPLTKNYWLSDSNVDVNYICHYRETA
ncbi:bifunctional 2-polyprenyl-6-hydroxyphenol methylase/3-demethylubiquinol 3-O-methyltransferase UbiG [Pleionea sp. CnH1-48]|uniref:bifunctional 2-polyprenyl-6-hydroxyphenol methylase/3-demethylubiquinol 3-O-methyltransferase UbiG n=1 Tax=Pleionea sp. CnH1-48 TaxID=2954494 RepID=UPI002097EB46|nr:bifunctional 2-polyprenyl-6-hydroxyphenol methylase/3-demethylubiquinol 3-O-methyltransferase UbiG [Pleionea sp. CnH1-48]MCO7223851.1 bifunctional 2-polyprenyl-6-hydroxyphenol methylase/3-demethylubiquinol 3-O-methyltransferase UbiG [Pleionea sp. CnH1-48]